MPFTIPFPFRMCKRPINMLGVSYWCKASLFTRRLELILLHCHGLLNFAGTLCCCRSSTSSLLCDPCSTGSSFHYRRSIELATQITSKWRRSTKILPISACHELPSVPFPFFLAWNGCSFPFRRNRTERKRHCFYASYCTCIQYLCDACLSLSSLHCHLQLSPSLTSTYNKNIMSTIKHWWWFNYLVQVHIYPT